MENIYIQRGERTPSFFTDYDKGIVEIRGRSMPEDSLSFYTKIQKWIDDFIDMPLAKRPITFTVLLEYYNTSSSKCLLDIFRTLGGLKRKGWNVSVNWLYYEDDDEMIANGIEFQSLLDYELNVVQYSEKSFVLGK